MDARNLRKATRLFEIIQMLRLATRPLTAADCRRLPPTAADMAHGLECGRRTVQCVTALLRVNLPLIDIYCAARLTSRCA